VLDAGIVRAQGPDQGVGHSVDRAVPPETWCSHLPFTFSLTMTSVSGSRLPALRRATVRQWSSSQKG